MNYWCVSLYPCKKVGDYYSKGHCIYSKEDMAHPIDKNIVSLRIVMKAM
jgi:hypothetical protein